MTRCWVKKDAICPTCKEKHVSFLAGNKGQALICDFCRRKELNKMARVYRAKAKAKAKGKKRAISTRKKS